MRLPRWLVPYGVIRRHRRTIMKQIEIIQKQSEVAASLRSELRQARALSSELQKQLAAAREDRTCTSGESSAQQPPLSSPPELPSE